MTKQKLRLSSPVFAGRIKKYDSYSQRGNYSRSSVKTEVINPANTKMLKPNLTTKSFKTVNSDTKNYSPVSLKKTKIESVNKNLSLETHVKTNVSRHLALRAVASSANYHSSTGDQVSSYIDSVYTNVSSKASKLQKLLYGFGVLVFIFSAGISVQTLLNNNDAKEQIATLGDSVTVDSQGVSEGTATEPSEVEVPLSTIQNYQVSDPTYPRFIRIPTLDVFSRVKDLGETPAGAVDAPKNIYDAGWYRGSAKPGSNSGASLIVAHVSGRVGPGVFKHIEKLKSGDAVQVERGNGELVNYEVTKVEEYPLDSINMASVLGTEQAGKNDLKLMTCSGKFNKETRLYDHRMVVYAKRI